MKEIWKDIEGYEGYYQVSNLGRVKSLKRSIRHESSNAYGKYFKYTHVKEKILKPCIASNKYDLVSFKKDGLLRTPSIHRLVAEAFIVKPKGKVEINHIDGNKQNNRADNLQWVTRSENAFHAYRTGLKSKKGERHHRNKLTRISVLEIRALWPQGWFTQGEIAEAYNVTTSAISAVLTRRTWKHI